MSLMKSAGRETPTTYCMPPLVSTKLMKEKDRRESETRYIEELDQLIRLDEHSDHKLIKNIVLEETLQKVRRLNNNTEESHDFPPVQESDVSSSRGHGTFDKHYMIQLLLKRYDAFIICLKEDGNIDEVTDSVKEVLGYSREELVGQSIHTFLKLGDQTTFAEKALKSIERILGFDRERSPSNKEFTVRFRKKVKEEDGVIDEFQPMQVLTYQNNSENSSESDHVIICIAQKATGTSVDGQDCADHRVVSQFTTRLSLPDATPALKVQDVDVHGLDNYNSINSPIQDIKRTLENKCFLDLCHNDDKEYVRKQLTELQQTNTGFKTCESYKFLLKSTWMFFSSRFARFQDSIMATHSILGEVNSLNGVPGGFDPETDNSGGGSPSGESSRDRNLEHHRRQSGSSRSALSPSLSPGSVASQPNPQFTPPSNDMEHMPLASPSSTWPPMIVPKSPSSSCHSNNSSNPTLNDGHSRPSSRQSSTPNSRAANSPMPPPNSVPPHSPMPVNSPMPVHSPMGANSPMTYVPMSQDSMGHRTPRDSKEENNDNVVPSESYYGSSRLFGILAARSGETDNGDKDKILKQLLEKTNNDAMNGAKNDAVINLLEGADNLANKDKTALLATLLNNTEGGKPVVDESMVTSPRARIPQKRQSQDEVGGAPPLKQPFEVAAAKPRNPNKMLLNLLKAPMSQTPSVPFNPELVGEIPQAKLPSNLEQKLPSRSEVAVSSSAGHWSGGTVSGATTQEVSADSTLLNNILVRQPTSTGGPQMVAVNADATTAPADSSDLTDIIDQINSLRDDYTPQPCKSPSELENVTGSVKRAEENEAIQAISRDLMACETVTTTPPNNTFTSHPPPVYQSRYTRPMVRAATTANQFAGQMRQMTPAQQQQQQQQQLQRLNYQRKQQLVIGNALPTNSDNMEDYAPNVSLQRSTSVPADSQLSPNYAGNQMLNSPTQRGPFSPQSPLAQQATTYQSPQGGVANYAVSTQAGAVQSQRMSPLQQAASQHYPQSQLSPRTHSIQQTATKFGSPSGVQSPGVMSPQTPTSSPGSWVQSPVSASAAPTRTANLLQSNPTLNARLATNQNTYTAVPYSQNNLVRLRSPSPRQAPQYQQHIEAYQQQRYQRALSSPASPAGHLGNATTLSYYPSPEPHLSPAAPLTPSYHPTAVSEPSHFHYDQQAIQQQQQQQQQHQQQQQQQHQQQQQRMLSPSQASGGSSQYVREKLHAKVNMHQLNAVGRRTDLPDSQILSILEDSSSVASPTTPRGGQMIEDPLQRGGDKRHSLLQQLLQDTNN